MKVVNKIKMFFQNPIINNLIIMGGMFTSFFILDVALRIFSNQYVSFFGWLRSAPNLFTFSWIFLTIGILYLIPKKGRLIVYPIFVLISNILVYAEYLHFNILKRFFAFSDLFLAKEGSEYFGYAIKQTNIKIILVLLISILAAVITWFLIKNTQETKRKISYYIIIILVTTLLVATTRTFAYKKLGIKKEPLTWEASFSAKNVYLDYNNQNKSLEVSGVYEFFLRGTYLYIKENYFSDKKQLTKSLDDELVINLKFNNKEDNVNEYTGVLEKKNVIYILLESIDDWLVTEDTMPTLYKLSQEGLNFTNRYSPTFGGGQTINSEFAMNTGLYALENSKAIYNYDSNTYSTSLANMLKKQGYSANSIHTNMGSFYNRTNFHQALGYDEHYSLDDIKTINHKDYNYYNDSSLVKNDETYQMIVREEPFLTFITTYSAHMPYDDTNDRCVTNPYNMKVEGDVELSCIRNLAKETDEMIRILIEKLKEDKLLDNTVLVLATDHYAYAYKDQKSIADYKGTSNENLLQKVPLIIWSNDIKGKQVDTLMDTADILPTLFNMMGINYNTNYYIGTDVFGKEHENYVYFSSDTFYNGVDLFSASKTNNQKNTDYEDTIIKKIKNNIDTNYKFIVTDYFKDK